MNAKFIEKTQSIIVYCPGNIGEAEPAFPRSPNYRLTPENRTTMILQAFVGVQSTANRLGIASLKTKMCYFCDSLIQ